MSTYRSILASVALLAGLLIPPQAVRAAQSLDTCAGFIDTLPATISTQGVWCLRQDLSTAITSGSAITIAANNVTIDCNDFKLGGLAAGTSSRANGILADSRLNATVRHCNVRGFYTGIFLLGGGGHLVEDNRLDQNLYAGIDVSGDNNRVQGNAVYDTGGAPASNSSFGISTSADIIDNTVAGMYATTTNSTVYAVFSNGTGAEIRGNRIRGLMPTGTGIARGILATANGVTLDRNRLSATTSTAGTGIYGVGTNTFCSNNTVVNFATAYLSCDAIDGNLSLP